MPSWVTCPTCIEPIIGLLALLRCVERSYRPRDAWEHNIGVLLRQIRVGIQTFAETGNPYHQ